uniref:HMA domain-containing protein n=1 Tax=Kalanchoe fedtschenkoi TaxID=63787 RepID=A0A7N0UE02_KALFE
MGEEGKKEDEQEKKKAAEEEEEIVLKVDMHCDACARKIARSLKGFEGVEEVTADCKASKVVVKGKSADPIKILDRIQKKCSRKVELISPVPKPPPETKPEVKDEPPKEDKKDEPPPVVTVVLSVRMHCEACALVIEKRIRKIKGVESVVADLGNDQVKISGVIVPEKLVEEVFKKTKKRGTIVKQKEKKEDAKKDEEEEKKKEGEAAEEEEEKKMDIKKSEHWPAARYNMEFAYAPQIFSDENPNACSVM